MHHAARRRRGRPISPVFVEGVAGEIVTRRMKKQQVREDRAAVQPFLDICTTVLNDTLADTVCYRHPGFRLADDDTKATIVAA